VASGDRTVRPRRAGEPCGQGGGRRLSRVVPLGQHPYALTGVEDLDVRDVLPRFGGQRVEQPYHPACHGIGGRPVEQVGVEQQGATHPGGRPVLCTAFTEAEEQVELGRAGLGDGR
jgi:hypothetical protein